MNSPEPQGAADAARRPTVTIEVCFDFICPWCLIGKRNLEAALVRFGGLRPDVTVKVQWHSHQLLPDTPLDGMPYEAFYLNRLGSHEAVAARRAQVRRAGSEAGIEFAFERIETMPNTAAAHDLIAYAGRRGGDAQRVRLIERLFSAYFMDGENIGDRRVLERIGVECGLERQGLADRLADSTRRAASASHADHRIGGVPHYTFNARYTLSGAHSPGAIVEAMMLAIRD
ncbi:DsbA family oxidoreductase [Caballeronia sp. J97]|uniref:DsbA family oxidoreductase n=1 Tax=Caballeronia sp. J97 TaxID=2805429 RepID=UPI002AAF9AB3|nr:DsbA family oxidoreductase [Caballeronia sp. J97]